MKTMMNQMMRRQELFLLAPKMRRSAQVRGRKRSKTTWLTSIIICSSNTAV